MNDKEISELVKRYVDSARVHGEATKLGNARKANRAYKEIVRAFLELEKYGDEGTTALMLTLGAEESAVRTWGATHLLKSHPERALPVLADVAREKSLVGFSAKVTLEEWTNGTLRFPPYSTTINEGK